MSPVTSLQPIALKCLDTVQAPAKGSHSVLKPTALRRITCVMAGSDAAFQPVYRIVPPTTLRVAVSSWQPGINLALPNYQELPSCHERGAGRQNRPESEKHSHGATPVEDGLQTGSHNLCRVTRGPAFPYGRIPTPSRRRPAPPL